MIFAQVGYSHQQVGGNCPDGWCEMKAERPSGEGWIASANGEWINGQQNAEYIRAMRAAAYRIESDPLFMEANYDDDHIKLQAWRDKVAEIKDRYPIPQ